MAELEKGSRVKNQNRSPKAQIGQRVKRRLSLREGLIPQISDNGVGKKRLIVRSHLEEYRSNRIWRFRNSLKYGKEYIDEYNYKIEVTSSVGKGSTLSFYFVEDRKLFIYRVVYLETPLVAYDQHLEVLQLYYLEYLYGVLEQIDME